jgi:hypothetical protein
MLHLEYADICFGAALCGKSGPALCESWSGAMTLGISADVDCPECLAIARTIRFADDEEVAWDQVLGCRNEGGEN